MKRIIIIINIIISWYLAYKFTKYKIYGNI
jgi:hypothetical protein